MWFNYFINMGTEWYSVESMTTSSGDWTYSLVLIMQFKRLFPLVHGRKKLHFVNKSTKEKGEDYHPRKFLKILFLICWVFSHIFLLSFMLHLRTRRRKGFYVVKYKCTLQYDDLWLAEGRFIDVSLLSPQNNLTRFSPREKISVKIWNLMFNKYFF